LGGKRTYAQEREHNWKKRGIMNTDGTPFSHEQFLAMLEAQGHRCAICAITINGNSHVDHNHETGQVRGLLCQPCNMALGVLERFITSGHVQAYLQLATGEEEESPLPPYYDAISQALRQYGPKEED